MRATASLGMVPCVGPGPPTGGSPPGPRAPPHPPRPAADLETDAAADDVAHLLVLVLVDGHRRALGDGHLDDSGAVAAGQGASDDAWGHLDRAGSKSGAVTRPP